jgi:dephospho-CoA kinase
VVRKTDIIYAPKLCPGTDLYLKTENLQITGSFKVRGSYYKMSKLTEEEKAKGVVACSAGNHAQGVALSAKKNGIKAVIIDAPVLFESGFDDLCDITVCVTAPYDVKLKRITERDGISSQKAQARLKSQLPDERLIELCDYEIKNDGEHSVEAQISNIIEKLNLGE